MTLQQPRPIISSIINRIHEVKDSLTSFFCAFPQIWKGFTFGQQIPMKTHSPPNQVPFWPLRVMVVPSPGVPYAMGPSLVGGYHPCWLLRGRWRPHGMPSPCCRRMAQWCGGAVAVVVPWTLGPNFLCEVVILIFWRPIFYSFCFFLRSEIGTMYLYTWSLPYDSIVIIFENCFLI